MAFSRTRKDEVWKLIFLPSHFDDYYCFHNLDTGLLGTFSLGNFKGRIPTWNDPDYFDLYRNPYSERTFPKVSYCRDLFNVSRDFFYFLLSPKFIATIIGIVTAKIILLIIEWGSKNIKWGIKNMWDLNTYIFYC